MWPSFFGSLLACADPPSAPVDDGWVWFGGDVTLGDAGRGTLGQLELDGLGVVDLVGPIGPHVDPPARYNMAPTLSELRALHVGVVGVANDHAQDAPTDTAKVLEAAGLPWAGVALLPVAGKTLVVAALDADHADLRLDLAEARARGDLLAVSLHATTDSAARAAVDHARAVGASIVVVHGGGVGRVEEHDGSVVAWGLGPLAVDADVPQPDGLVLRVHVPELRVELVPIAAGTRTHPATLSPHKAAILEQAGAS